MGLATVIIKDDGAIEPTDDKPQTAGLSIPALGTIV